MYNRKAVKHYEEGRLLQQQGELSAAERAYQKAVKINPEFFEAHNNLGNVLQARGRLKEAYNAFRKALNYWPDHPEILNNLGNSLQLQGEIEDSLTKFDRCIAIKPDYIDAYVNRGISLTKLGRLEGAKSSYLNAIRLDSENAVANINLAKILSNQGKFKEAIEVLQIPLRRDPKNVEALRRLVGTLNFYSPEAAEKGSHAELQEKIAKIAPASIDTLIISKDAVQKLYQQSYSEIISSGLSYDKYGETQIWRGKVFYLGCERHFVVFNRFNAIPKYCFDCYKVYIEPRTVLEMFKLMIVFDSIDLPGDKARKCMIETRPEVAGAYKGYVYCQSYHEGMEVLTKVREVVASRISKNVQVVLKRGCSEFALAYPEFVQNDENGKPKMRYKKEWIKHEEFTDRNLVKHVSPPVIDNYNHSGLTLRDTLVMHNWLAYAATIGDLSYMEISGAAVEKLPIDKRQASKSPD